MTSDNLSNIWKIIRTFTYNNFGGQKYNKIIIWWKSHELCGSTLWLFHYLVVETLHVKYEDLEIKKITIRDLYLCFSDNKYIV